MSAVVLSGKIVDTIERGSGLHTQGFTYSGNPVSCAAGLATIQYIEDHDLIRRADALGAYVKERLEKLLEIDIVGAVRGTGLLLGIEFVRDKGTKTPFPAGARLTERLVEIAYEMGLMIVGGMPGCADGTNGDQIQITPAFVFRESQIDEAVEILERAIRAVRAVVLAEDKT